MGNRFFSMNGYHSLVEAHGVMAAITFLGVVPAAIMLAQVALGLTLYGSPKYLFVLYTLWTFGLVLLYFILSWVRQRRPNAYDGDGSYISEEQFAQGGGHDGPSWGKLAAFGAVGAGLVA